MDKVIIITSMNDDDHQGVDVDDHADDDDNDDDNGDDDLVREDVKGVPLTTLVEEGEVSCPLVSSGPVLPLPLV